MFYTQADAGHPVKWPKFRRLGSDAGLDTGRLCLLTRKTLKPDGPTINGEAVGYVIGVGAIQRQVSTARRESRDDWRGPAWWRWAIACPMQRRFHVWLSVPAPAMSTASGPGRMPLRVVHGVEDLDPAYRKSFDAYTCSRCRTCSLSSTLSCPNPRRLDAGSYRRSLHRPPSTRSHPLGFAAKSRTRSPCSESA
jgi:hypothetical protein